MADMTSEARVVVLDRLRPGDVAGDLLDVVFGWTDFTRLRRLVAGQCAAAGLTGSRLDNFVLAVPKSRPTRSCTRARAEG